MNLCIGVGTRFRLDSLVETLGHSLRFFMLDYLKLFDAYRIIDSRILVVTLEYLGDIRVG